MNHNIIVFFRKALHSIKPIPCIRCRKPVEKEMLDGWGGGFLRIPCVSCFIEGRTRIKLLERNIRQKMTEEERYLFVQMYLRELKW